MQQHSMGQDELQKYETMYTLLPMYMMLSKSSMLPIQPHQLLRERTDRITDLLTEQEM